MATNFPTTLDDFTNPTSNTSMVSVSHAAQHTAANDAIEALQAKVGVTNSEVDTSLTYRLDSIESSGDIALGSTNSGGLNTTDSTKRVNLSSYQKAQRLAADASTPAHFGEVLRIDLEADQAKAMIAWRENYTESGPRTVAWVGAHGASNDDPDVWHNHFSIETPDTNGNLYTRLEVPFAAYDDAEGFGLDASDSYVRIVNSKFLVNSANGGQHIEGAAETDRALHFSTGSYGDDANRRWSLMADSTAESGSAVGSDLRVKRRTDDGTQVDTVVFIKRSSGDIGLGTDVTSPSGKVHVQNTSDKVGILMRNTNVGGHNNPNIASDSQTSTSRAFQVGLQTDTTKRWIMDASGKMDWGPGGSSSRDTNLYRSGANVLATDDSFTVGTDLNVAGDLNHDGSEIGFYGTAPVSQQVLATGVGASVDNVITVLQNLGLVSQT